MYSLGIITEPYGSKIDLLHEDDKKVLFLKPAEKTYLGRIGCMFVLKIDQYNKQLAEKLIQNQAEKSDLAVKGSIALAGIFKKPVFFKGCISVNGKPKYEAFLPTNQEGTEIYACKIEEIAE